MKKKLDFICIGAAKAATTTLFDLIKDHPQIYIPESKEAAFFNNDEYWAKGYDWYLKNFFSKADKDSICGTITPQYMNDSSINIAGGSQHDKTSSRIYESEPGIKLIALLRNPIGRSFSYHKMRRRNGYTDKTFEEESYAIFNNKSKNIKVDENNNFIYASEYGRILSVYFKKFPKQNILVIFTEDLNSSPKKTLKKVFDFLEVSSGYTPDNINRKSHVGGGKPKIRLLTPGHLRDNRVFMAIWKLLPAKLRKNLYYKVMFWNVKSDKEKLDKDSDIYKALIKYFKPDVKKLEKLIGKKTPWDEWRR